MGSILCCHFFDVPEETTLRPRKKSYYTAPETENTGEAKLKLEDEYLKMEFTAMADVKNPKGIMTGKEFLQLLMFLGYDASNSRGERLLVNINKDNVAYVTWEEYITAMRFYPEVKEETKCLRTMFAKFDDNDDAHAYECQIKEGLENEFQTTLDKATIQKIHGMDENQDGKISYEEFIRTSLRLKGII